MIKKKRIVYLEDDQNSLDIVEFILHTVMGFDHVHAWNNSTNVMEKLRRLDGKPDLVLLDIHMEPIDGFKVIEMLREDEEYKKVCVIALTASFMKEEVSKLKGSGFDGGIAKPIDRDTFPDVIKRVLNGEEIWHIAGVG